MATRAPSARIPRRLDVLGEIVDRSRTIAARPPRSAAEMRTLLQGAAARVEHDAARGSDAGALRRSAVELAAAALFCRTAARSADGWTPTSMDGLGDVLSGMNSMTAGGWPDASEALARWRQLLQVELNYALGAGGEDDLSALRSGHGLASVAALCAELVLWVDSGRFAASR